MRGLTTLFSTQKLRKTYSESKIFKILDELIYSKRKRKREILLFTENVVTQNSSDQTPIEFRHNHAHDCGIEWNIAFMIISTIHPVSSISSSKNHHSNVNDIMYDFVEYTCPKK